MLTIPDSLKVQRNNSAEKKLVDDARGWLEREERAPGIHASDMLDTMKAYMQRIFPKPISDKKVAIFMIGKVLHGFVLSAADGKTGFNVDTTDEGSFVSEDLGLTWSPDKMVEGKVRELKTSRSFYEPKTVGDLKMYLEQLLVYMAATGTLESQLWVLYLNLKDDQNRTNPSFRAYDITITPEDLEKVKSEVKANRTALTDALKNEDPSSLPLCRDWLCGPRMCEWWHECKPKGRYGEPKWEKK